MFEFMQDIGSYEDRKVDRWDSEDMNTMVSTAKVSDGRKPFETAVMHPAYNNGNMVIVSCYDTKEEAQIGHDKWLNLVHADKLPQPLIDCANAEIGQILDAIGGDMAFERDSNQ